MWRAGPLQVKADKVVGNVTSYAGGQARSGLRREAQLWTPADRPCLGDRGRPDPSARGALKRSVREDLARQGKRSQFPFGCLDANSAPEKG